MFFFFYLSTERDCPLYFVKFLTGQVCLCIQEKKEQSMQCQVLFCKMSSLSLLFLDAICSSQANQMFQAGLLWADETPFNPFHTAAENWTCATAISLHFPYTWPLTSFPDPVLFDFREKWYVRLSFFFLFLLKINGIKCHISAFGMHILAFSVVQLGKDKFLIELVCSVSALYWRFLPLLLPVPSFPFMQRCFPSDWFCAEVENKVFIVFHFLRGLPLGNK